MNVLELIFRWAHILAALTLFGGVTFLRFAVVPTFQKAAPAEIVFESIRAAWSKMVMLSVLFLLVSGLYNAYLKAVTYQLDMIYLTLLSLKMILALVVFFLVSVLSGRSERAVSFRSGTGWYDVTFITMLLLVGIAGFMKVQSTDAPRKVRDATEARMVIENDSSNPIRFDAQAN